MMKSIRLTALLAAALAFTSCENFTDNYPIVFAHRGCWLGDIQTPGKVTEYYVPENSIDGIRMAARMGYPTIELDVRWTLDSVLVCMHDETINRTMRNAADQSPIDGDVFVRDMTFEQLRTRYALASVDPEMQRHIPTLEELLKECDRCGIKPIMHCNIYEGYEVAIPILGNRFIAFSSNFDVCKRTRAITDNQILFDAGNELNTRGLEATPENVIALLDEIGGDIGTSSMGLGITAPEMVRALHSAGHPVQSSIYPTPNEAYAVRNGADILLSDFCWRPAIGMKPAKSSIIRDNGTDGSATVSFEECELGALTVMVKGKGRCTITVEEHAATGSIETREYEFGEDDDQSNIVTERLSFRFWKTAATIRLNSAPGSNFKLKAELYRF